VPDDQGRPTPQDIEMMRRLDEMAFRRVREFLARFHEIVEFERSLQEEQPAKSEAAVPNTKGLTKETET
jgi:hypothetical protein